MNKIFKIIWSKARNCYVVVSELAKSHDDGHVRRSRCGCARKAAVLAALVLTMGVSGAALAADMPKSYTQDNVEYTLFRISGLTGVYYNSDRTKYALVTYSDNNYNDKTTKTATIKDIVKYDTTSTHDYSVNSSGEKSADGQTIIDSNYTNTGAIGTGALTAGVNALAAGTDSVAIGTGATATGNGATVIGQYASASGQYATAFGGLKTRNSKNNEVIYYRNEANGDASVAFGEGTKANGEASLAFGHNTIAGARGGGQQSVAFGENTKALGGRSLAFGENTMAEFNDSVAFGNASRALSTGSLAHGNRTNAVGQYSTSWGNNTVAAGENATVFGTDAMAGAIDENGAIIITDNNNNQVKIDKNGYKAFIDTNGKTQSVTYTVTDGEIHKYLVLTDANNQNKYICDYHGNIHQLYYVDDKGIVQSESGILATSNIEKIDPGSNGYLIKNQKNATAFGNATRATAAESTAWGQESIASGEASTAFGIGSKAEEKNSLAALGGLAANENSIAIGQGTKANNGEGFVSAAIGQNAIASGKKSLALGFAGENAETSSTVASGENALALGTGAQALAKNSISIGAGNKVSGEGSGAIGDPTDITGTGSYELGNDNGTYTENAYTDTSFNANDSGIFGNKNTVHGGTADSPLVNIRVVGNNNTVTASNALVLGNHSIVPATGGIAIGNSVKSGVGQYNTLGSNTTAIGNESQAYHDNAVAIGTESKATGTGSIAIGDEASTLSNQGEEKQPTDAIAIGTKAKVERGDSSIAIGKNADILADGENTQNNIAIGTDTYIRHGSSSVVMGNEAKDNSDTGYSIVLGNRAIVAQSVTSNGIAIGTEAEVANTNGGVAIGNGAKATNTNGGDGSPVAVGQSAKATGTQAVAIGYNAIADNNQVGQTVVGSNASATANYGTIIGYGAKGTNTQANQTAIGYLATTNAAGGVALGANSNSDRPYDSTSATSPYIPTGASDEQTNLINATKATTGAVSVGYTDSSDSSKNVRRQIINVAAGKEDTDAVNVAQLKAVQSQSASADRYVKSGSINTNNGTLSLNVENVTDPVEITGLTDYQLDTDTTKTKYDAGTHTLTLATKDTMNGGKAGASVTFTGIANTDDVEAAKTEVKGGTNIVSVDKDTTSATDGHTIYTVNAKDTTVSADDDNLVLTTTPNTETNVTNYGLKLANKVTIGSGDNTHPVTVDGTTGQVTGLQNTTLDVAGFAQSNRAATEEQLKAMQTTVTGADRYVKSGSINTNNGTLS
ncbi:ESPR-type extended signal peptide-containing protein, partial [uncultured Megasphaera sp.]|uniref:ESPR-type extended signal peptide-containing protein n=1 Tax=uncultured Megasphaera sp. TaxID=165188 RepID=UPI002617556C